MLAPVGEAHFGEDALTALNLAAARAWPAFARELEAALGRDRPLPDRRHPAGGRRPFRPGRHRRPARLPARARPDRPPALGLPSAGRRAAARPGVCGGADLADDHQVDNRRVVDGARGRLPGRAGSRSSGTRSPRSTIERRTGRPAWSSERRRLGRRHRGAGRRLPLRPARRAARRPSGHRSARSRGSPSGSGPRPGPRGSADRPWPGPRAVLLPGPAGGRHRRGRGHRRGEGVRPLRAGRRRSATSSTTPVGWCPSLEEYELVETTTGLRPGSPDNGPHRRVRPAITGLLVATGHYRNGILLAPVTADEVVGLLAGGRSLGRTADPRRPAPVRRRSVRTFGRRARRLGPARLRPGDRAEPGGRSVTAVEVNGAAVGGPAGDDRGRSGRRRGAPRPKGIAVARNGEVVPKSTWDAHRAVPTATGSRS